MESRTQLPISVSLSAISAKWQPGTSQQNGDPCSRKWSVYQTRSSAGGRPCASTSSATNKSPGRGRPQTVETASSMMRFNSCLDRLSVIHCVLSQHVRDGCHATIAAAGERSQHPAAIARTRPSSQCWHRSGCSPASPSAHPVVREIELNRAERDAFRAKP